MHTIVHKLLDGGVGSYPPNPEVLATMTESGLGWDAGRIAGEAAKFTVPAPDWAGFPGAFATEWATALGLGGLTEAAALDLFTRRIQLRRGYTVSAVVEEALLPTQITSDRYFRDAVVWDDTVPSKCRCDMPKARVIHMDRIRVARDAELKKLDVTFIRAIEVGDTAEQQRIAALKQALRDIPQTFGLSSFRTPNTLKNAWPQGLPR